MDRLFSIVMPMFNASKYLKEALESLRNQKYKNFSELQ